MKNKFNISKKKYGESFYRHKNSLILSFCEESIKAYFKSIGRKPSRSLVFEVRSTNPRKKGWRLAKLSDGQIKFCGILFVALDSHIHSLRAFNGKLWIKMTPD